MNFQYFQRIVVLAALLLSTPFAYASQWSDELKIRIDEKIQKQFSSRSQVGIVVGVVKDGETHVWSYGERVLGSGEMPTGDTFFEMGSITKTYTATMLALEIVRGRLHLSDPIKSLWHDLDGSDAGEITLEQLATHSSGLPRMPDNFEPQNPLNPYKDYDEVRLLDFLKRFKREGKAPFPYAYSNVGLGLLGHILASKLNRETFGEYLQRNLLSPLGLGDTKVALHANDLQRAAQGYGSFFQLLPFWDLNVLDPAGVLKTTVNDLLKYTKFNIDADSTSILGQAANLAHLPRAATDEEGARIGLAWESVKLGQYSVTTHGGATGGYRANLAFDKAKHVGAVILSNTDISPKCVLSTVFDVECVIPDWAAVDPSLQKKFVGAYHSEALEMNADVFIESGLLGLNPEGQPKLRLWAKSDLDYRIPDADAGISFKETNDKYDTFILTQNGKSFDFVRK